MILAARREDALQEVAAACKTAHQESGIQSGGKFVTVKLDVSDSAQVKKFMDGVPAELKNIDVLGEPTLLKS